MNLGAPGLDFQTWDWANPDTKSCGQKPSAHFSPDRLLGLVADNYPCQEHNGSEDGDREWLHGFRGLFQILVKSQPQPGFKVVLSPPLLPL